MTTDRTSTTPQVDARSVHEAVDRIVMAHGIYAPWELLLDQGRLDYHQYEAWRTGALALLVDGLHGNVDRVEALLSVAAQWSLERGFCADASPPTGWGPMAGQALRCARDDAMNALLGTVFRPDEASVQRDMFVDAGETLALANLRGALVARDVEGAFDALHELLRRAPDHRLRSAAERLCDALADLGDVSAPVQPADELARLRGPLANDASDVLGALARDFEVSFWRRLARAQASVPFEPGTPELHASYALARCLDWSAAREAVLQIEHFEQQPILLLRLIEAERHLANRTAALTWCVELCWRHPEAAEHYLETDPSCDHAIQRAWESLLDVDDDTAPGVRWLPAWLLLAEPGLAHALDATPTEDTGPAGAGFLALRQLLRRPGAGPDAATIEGRKQLAAASPVLLRAYLAAT